MIDNRNRNFEAQRVFESLPDSNYIPKVVKLEGSTVGYFISRNGVVVSSSGVRLDMNYSMLKPIISTPAIALLSFIRRGASHVAPLSNGQSFGIIHSPWTAGYYHWLTESLPRAIALKKAYPDSVPLLPSRKYLNYVDSLKALGFRDVKFFPENKNVHLSELVITSSPARFGTTSPESLSAVRDEVFKNLRLERASLSEVVYISRSKSRGRFVLNEDEILQKISHFHPKVVHCEDLSFADQVSLMRRTKLLISIHGAGLTNMLFMPKGAKVLELLPRRSGMFDFNSGRFSFKHDACYLRLASSLALGYNWLENSASAGARQSTHMANIHVDPNNFMKSVEAMMRDCCI